MMQNKAEELNLAEASTGWTLFVRLTHWLVAVSVMTNFFNDTGFWHRAIGYGCLGLVLVRIVYGLCISKISASQFYRPTFLSIRQHVIAIFTKKLTHHVGHNPLGQCAVYIMWLLIMLLAFTGWLSRTDLFWGEDWPVDCHKLFPIYCKVW